MKITYEDKNIVVRETGQDFGFIATIENKTDENIAILPDDNSDYETLFEAFDIQPLNWVGLLANEEGRSTLRAIKENKFSANFNPDYI